MSYGRRNIIKLTPGDDYGVYISRSRGPLGTSLQFRGTWDQVTNLVCDHGTVAIYDDGGYKPLQRYERGLGIAPHEH